MSISLAPSPFEVVRESGHTAEGHVTKHNSRGVHIGWALSMERLYLFLRLAACTGNQEALAGLK